MTPAPATTAPTTAAGPVVPVATVANVLDRCLAVGRGEEVVLLTDAETDPAVVAALAAGIEERDAVCVIARVPRYQVPGSEPPSSVGALLAEAAAAIELTSTFIGSSTARQEASRAGTRYLAMPAVRASTFRTGGPLDVDFDELRRTVEVLAAAWAGADTYRITSPAGTDITGSVRGRGGRALHGIAREPGAYMAPPDVEAGTAPVEGSTDGVVVIDADLLFMGVGPLPSPVALTFRGGQLVDIAGEQAGRLTDMIDRVADPRMSNLAEVSVGLNPNGRVCGVAMETESTLGTAHIALGNSIAYGGTVAAAAHLDCVLRAATLYLDGRPVLVEGALADDLEVG
ncbi:Leucyl aminopeptidase (aminopeptidase T)-like protein [Parafrankia sp. EUN1f]|nr:Leucyl aminopeptidase (aminopeptidase T)-like protein [Parafrankia sp. EUN1f]